MSNTHDWSKFTVRVNVKAPINKLYQSWATREGIEEWFLRMSEYKKPDGSLRKPNEFAGKGDTYAWRWHGYGDEATEHGEILECNDKDFFKFRFGNAGNCSIKIYEEQGENIVELLQDNIPTTEEGKQNWHVGCKTGWTFYLANLKSLYEGGIDLRNKREEVTNVITA